MLARTAYESLIRRHRVAQRFAIPVVVEKPDGKIRRRGTGILIQANGQRFVFTCSHVTRKDSSDDRIYFLETDRSFHFLERFDRHRAYLGLDLHIFRLPPDYNRATGKAFYNAAEAWLGDVDEGTRLLLSGYPSGEPGLARESGGYHGLEEEKGRRLTASCITYGTEAMERLFNRSVGEVQRTLSWKPSSMINARTNKAVTRSDRLIAQGLSGGPVFIEDPLRLAGWITHSDYDDGRDDRLYFFAIQRALTKIGELL